MKGINANWQSLADVQIVKIIGFGISPVDIPRASAINAIDPANDVNSDSEDDVISLNSDSDDEMNWERETDISSGYSSDNSMVMMSGSDQSDFFFD